MPVRRHRRLTNDSGQRYWQGPVVQNSRIDTGLMSPPQCGVTGARSAKLRAAQKTPPEEGLYLL